VQRMRPDRSGETASSRGTLTKDGIPNVLLYFVAHSDGKPGATFPECAVSLCFVAHSDGKPVPTFPECALGQSVSEFVFGEEMFGNQGSDAA